jgi:hypothetical protein
MIGPAGRRRRTSVVENPINAHDLLKARGTKAVFYRYYGMGTAKGKPSARNVALYPEFCPFKTNDLGQRSGNETGINRGLEKIDRHL